MKKLLLLFILCFTITGNSQQTSTNFISLSNKAEISVITCGPGDEVYAAFGHSAFRIEDKKNGIDRVYNYGTFNFNTPNFYGKFAQGNLLYLLSAYDFNRFVGSYYKEGRWVKAQVLDLKPSEVQACFEFLENNALPENSPYLYDYFFDNCSTRLYDVIDEVVGEKLVIPETFKNSKGTHRSLIQPYLVDKPWGDFGIDIALGSVIDRAVSMEEFLFLPENVFTFFDQLKINENGVEKNIVKRTDTILKAQEKDSNSSFFSPFILFSVFSIFVVLITGKDKRKKQRTKWLDFTLFFGIGLLGLMLSLISFATNHASAANNFNLLWAFAPNLLVSFVLLKKELPMWIHTYCLGLLILMGLLLLIWLLQIQIFSNAVIPILLLLGYRYYYLWKLKPRS
ncbi:Lnb N-terminal periplasmic domain-containing protein [Urechidicola vernalis]|uniref:DUF4105 domain-containing protein n=1 Tax=Urechidicola vernalis TaxID=3075600 RepID=A0ABU2Y3M6_9FLAO|nr:DUF4105 domain-containing protein [Urechidicola sp. P050]MDT0552254.1 DUF4105 domain-containing protein [Urechidicola sp. P050]